MSRWASAAALLLVAACGRVSFQPTAGDLDAGLTPPADAGLATDAARAPRDAGPTGVDAGSSPADGGGTADAAPPPADSGPIMTDAALPPVDAGAVPRDAGSPGVDAGVVIPDAGPAGADAGIAHGCDAGAGVCDVTSYCRGRIAWTDNAYLPYAECIYQLDAARAACNADPTCTLCGYNTITDGVGGTAACRDGGGMTGLRQWNCWPVAAVPMGQIPI